MQAHRPLALHLLMHINRSAQERKVLIRVTLPLLLVQEKTLTKINLWPLQQSTAQGTVHVIIKLLQKLEQQAWMTQSHTKPKINLLKGFNILLQKESEFWLMEAVKSQAESCSFCFTTKQDGDPLSEQGGSFSSWSVFPRAHWMTYINGGLHH